MSGVLFGVIEFHENLVRWLIIITTLQLKKRESEKRSSITQGKMPIKWWGKNSRPGLAGFGASLFPQNCAALLLEMEMQVTIVISYTSQSGKVTA